MKAYLGMGVVNTGDNPKKIRAGFLKFRGLPSIEIGFIEINGDLEQIRSQAYNVIDKVIKETKSYEEKEI